MNFNQMSATMATMAALMGVAGTAQAGPVFEGRDATGAASSSCTASGASKCTYFYDTILDITILNNWNIGSGTWDANGSSGSAQALVEAEGFSTSGLTGWVLPTGDGGEAAGAQNQFLSIWNSVGGNFSGLSGQFDGVQGGRASNYWSGSAYAPVPGSAWRFLAAFGDQAGAGPLNPLFAVAVRAGDVADATAVPEPESYALVLLGLGALGLMKRRGAR